MSACYKYPILLQPGTCLPEYSDIIRNLNPRVTRGMCTVCPKFEDIVHHPTVLRRILYQAPVPLCFFINGIYGSFFDPPS